VFVEEHVSSLLGSFETVKLLRINSNTSWIIFWKFHVRKIYVEICQSDLLIAQSFFKCCLSTNLPIFGKWRNLSL
jgi:hypothetical protein